MYGYAMVYSFDKVLSLRPFPKMEGSRDGLISKARENTFHHQLRQVIVLGGYGHPSRSPSLEAHSAEHSLEPILTIVVVARDELIGI